MGEYTLLIRAVIAFAVAFLGTAFVGLMSTWIDRKVTARVQARVGPPWYQPFADFLKLMGKETLIPEGSRRTGFLIAPLVGLAGIVLASCLIWYNDLYPDPRGGFVGDLIVVIYLLVVPSIALMMGASASGNPLAALGASREMKLILAYELPFLIAMVAAIVAAAAGVSATAPAEDARITFRFGSLLHQQHVYGVVAWKLSGIIAFIVALLCIHAKLAFVPFDIPEAETEIASGVILEYSGPLLAVIKLTRAMMLFTLPALLVVVFMGGFVFEGISILWAILKYVGILVAIILIKNTNPRLRIDQALKFFWGPMTILAIVALVLAVVGW